MADTTTSKPEVVATTTTSASLATDLATTPRAAVSNSPVKSGISLQKSNGKCRLSKQHEVEEDTGQSESDVMAVGVPHIAANNGAGPSEHEDVSPNSDNSDVTIIAAAGNGDVTQAGTADADVIHSQSASCNDDESCLSATSSLVAQSSTDSSKGRNRLTRSAAISDDTGCELRLPHQPCSDPLTPTRPAQPPRHHHSTPDLLRTAGETRRQCDCRQRFKEQYQAVSETSSQTSHDSDFTLYEDTSETNLDEYIPTELKGRKRQFLLQMETLLINFVNSTDQIYLLNTLDGYERKIVHRLSQLFRLGHGKVPNACGCMLLRKTPNSHVPEKRLEDYTELDDTPKKILPRSESSYSNLRDSQVAAAGAKKSRSLQERQQFYVQTKERIFKGQGASQELQDVRLLRPQDSKELLHVSTSQHEPPAASALPTTCEQRVDRWVRNVQQSGAQQQHVSASSTSRQRQWNSLDCAYRSDAAQQRHKIASSKASSFHFMTSFARADSRAGSGVGPALALGASRLSICESSPSLPESGISMGSRFETIPSSPPDLDPSLAEEDQHDMRPPTMLNERGEQVLFWVCSTLDVIPPGSVIINPQTRSPYYYDDGTPWVWPVRHVAMQPHSDHDTASYCELQDHTSAESHLRESSVHALSSTALKSTAYDDGTSLMAEPHQQPRASASTSSALSGGGGLALASPPQPDTPQLPAAAAITSQQSTPTPADVRPSPPIHERHLQQQHESRMPVPVIQGNSAPSQRFYFHPGQGYVVYPQGHTAAPIPYQPYPYGALPHAAYPAPYRHPMQPYFPAASPVYRSHMSGSQAAVVASSAAVQPTNQQSFGSSSAAPTGAPPGGYYGHTPQASQAPAGTPLAQSTPLRAAVTLQHDMQTSCIASSHEVSGQTTVGAAASVIPSTCVDTSAHYSTTPPSAAVNKSVAVTHPPMAANQLAAGAARGGQQFVPYVVPAYPSATQQHGGSALFVATSAHSGVGAASQRPGASPQRAITPLVPGAPQMPAAQYVPSQVYYMAAAQPGSRGATPPAFTAGAVSQVPGAGSQVPGAVSQVPGGGVGGVPPPTFIAGSAIQPVTPPVFLPAGAMLPPPPVSGTTPPPGYVPASAMIPPVGATTPPVFIPGVPQSLVANTITASVTDAESAVDMTSADTLASGGGLVHYVSSMRQAAPPTCRPAHPIGPGGDASRLPGVTSPDALRLPGVAGGDAARLPGVAGIKPAFPCAPLHRLHYAPSTPRHRFPTSPYVPSSDVAGSAKAASASPQSSAEAARPPPPPAALRQRAPAGAFDWQPAVPTQPPVSAAAARHFAALQPHQHRSPSMILHNRAMMHAPHYVTTPAVGNVTARHGPPYRAVLPSVQGNAAAYEPRDH